MKIRALTAVGIAALAPSTRGEEPGPGHPFARPTETLVAGAARK